MPAFTEVVDPWVDVDRLSFRRKREILHQAARNFRFLDAIRYDNRRTIESAARMPFGDYVNVAAVVIINCSRRLAAVEGLYNEWPKIEQAVMNSRYHDRPLFRELRPFAVSGLEPVVFTIENSDRRRVQTKHAMLYLLQGDICIEEYWPRGSDFQGFPSIKTKPLD